MTLTDSDIKGYLRNNHGYDPQFPYLPVFGDTSYEYPTERYFFEEFPKEAKQFFAGLDDRPWYQKLLQMWFRPDQWDCDDFARGAAWFAQVQNRRKGKGRAAIAIAEFWYYRKGVPGDEHAVIMGMFSPNLVGFIEPQTWQPMNVFPNEICTFYRF